MMLIFRIILLSIIMDNSALASDIIQHNIRSKIEFKSDNMIVNEKKGYILFEGHVTCVQNNLKIESQKAVINFDHKKSKLSINDIIYKQDVKFELLNYKASGDEAKFNFKDKMFTITGDVILTKDDNEIKGKYLVYDVSKGIVEIKGDTHHKPKMIINIP